MKRRGFFGLLAGLAGVATVAKASTPPPAVVNLDSPITGMVTFKEKLYVSTSAGLYELDKDWTPRRVL